MAPTDSVLPPLFRGWLEPILGSVPGETRSTCSRCAMLNWPDRPPLELAFHPRTKCCTYHPDLPNFQVGRVLADPAPLGAESRRILRTRIAERVGVTPMGVGKPPIYRTLYENAPAAFGRAGAMRCPHYLEEEGGLCGIWAHRESICSTWFCKHDRGAVGKVYWRVMQTVMSTIELSLKLWALREAGLDEGAMADLWGRSEVEQRGGKAPLDDRVFENAVDLDRYKKDWGGFFGREEELFVRCGELVSGLTSDDVLRIGGMVVAAAIDTARYVRKKLAEPLPERVQRGHNPYFQIRRRHEVRVRHQGAPLDWLDLPDAVARELERFEHGPVREVLAALRSEGVPIDEELVRRLLDWQVLVEP